MDEINDFFDFSKEFVRKPTPTGSVSNNPVAMGGLPVDSKPLKRTHIGDDYSKAIKQNEARQMMNVDFNNPDSMGAVSAMDTLEGLSKQEVKPQIDDIYDRYTFNLHRDKNQPIYEKKSEILGKIRENPVVILEGDTGCGKTTQVPQYILDDGYSRREHVNIIVTQPRRIAAMSVARRVASERQWETGTVVGFQVGLHTEISEDTRLLYCTTGVLLQKLVKEKSLNRYTHIVLDEVHERDQDMDFLLIVVRRLLVTNSRRVKIILMSATINTQEFSEYFWLCSKPAPILRVDTHRRYHVQEFFLNDLQRININNIDVDLNKPGISYDMYNVATKLIIVLENIEKKEGSRNKIGDDDTTILVFLPGINEIDQLYKKIEMLKDMDKNVKLWPMRLHSLISPDEQYQIFLPCPKGHHKLILATNIAESSITITGVKYVIDFCLTKVLITDTASNFSSLQLRWASKANCIQRTGRAGRVSNGRVYRLVTKSFYENFLEPYVTPEMLRCPLENVVLKAKLLDFGSPSYVLALAMDSPNLSDIKNTILRLKEVGALYVHTNGHYTPEDGDLSFWGRIMASLPLDIRLSRLIILGYVFSMLEDTIRIAAGLSVRSIFQCKHKDTKTELDSYIQRLVWADGSGSDLFAILKAYSTWVAMREQHNMSEDAGEATWARRLFINLRLIKEMHLLITELRQRLNHFGIRENTPYQRVHWIDREKTIILKIIIAGAFYPNYFVRSNVNDVERERKIYHTLCGNDPCSTVFFTNFNPRYIGHLYVRCIKDLFKDLNIQKKNIEVRFQHGSERVFVTFKSDPDAEAEERNNRLVVPGRVRSEIYKALCMHQLQLPTKINVMEPRAAMKFAEERHYGTIVDGMWMPKKKELKNIELIVLPSLFQKIIRGTITHITHCSKFFFQPSTEENQVRIILNMLNTFEATQSFRFTNAAAVSRGMILAAPYEGIYQRAKIINVITSSGQTVQFKVLFIDYGYTAVVDFEDLRYFPPELDYLHDIPPRVFECRLAMVQPSSVKSPNGKWSEEANTILKQAADAGSIDMKVYSLVGSVANVMLPMGACTINEILVDKGLARKSDENYMSKADHDERTRKQSTMHGPFSKDLVKQNEDYIRSTLNILDEEFEPPPSVLCTKSINLRGPFSPLATKVFSAMRIGQWKGVQIDRDSVNCALIDCDPQDLHERLLVAANITENPVNDTLVARGTTQMPNIPGFSALMTLMFCPTMQIKRDKNKAKYVSILAGLGYDEETKQSLYAEHDIVLSLDTEILTNDLELINQFRYSVETLLYTGAGDEFPRVTPNERANLTAKIKDNIIRLFNKNRKYIDMHVSADDHEWQTLDPDDVVGTTQIYETRCIFPMHSVERLYDEKFDRMHALGVHCQELHGMAKLEGSIQPFTCQLCNQMLENIAQLRIHLLSQLHRDREHQINFKFTQ